MNPRPRCASEVLRAGVLALLAVVLACSGHAIAGPAWGARVKQLDGGAFEGELVSITDQAASFRVAGDERTVGIEQLERIEFSAAGAHDRASAWCELTDGTVLPLAAWRWDALQALVQPFGPLGQEQRECSVDPAAIRAILQQELRGSEMRSWEALVLEQRTSDAAVLRREEGVLDSVDVVVENSSEESCEVVLDGEKVTAPRERIVGLIFAPTERDASARQLTPARLLARGPDRLKIAAARVALSPQGGMEFESLVGFRLRVPAATLDVLDFSPGNALYLSDLEPQSSEWRPCFAEQEEVGEIERRFGAPRFDRAFDGRPLRLVVATGEPPQQFAKGIALRSGATLRYELPPGYSGLTALAGIDPEAPEQADLRLVIEGDGHPLGTHEFRAGGVATQLQVDVQDVRQLQIVVEYGANLDIGDRLHLVDARLVR